MIDPQSVRESMLFSTVRVVAETADGALSFGTAFRFQIKLDKDHSMSTLITNKHVVEDATKCTFTMHTATDSGKPSDSSYDIELDNAQLPWFYHPDDDVDLCALWFDPFRSKAEADGAPLYDPALTEDMIWSETQLGTLDVEEEVTMIGYPIALWDETNNLPLFRRGVTATHPAIDFNGKSVTVVDIACFPGSSGSPVVWINPGMRPWKGGGCTFGNGKTEVVLLGVLYAGPVHTSYGKLEAQPLPTAVSGTVSTHQMINLGYIIKAKEITALGDYIRNELQSSGMLPPSNELATT